MMGRLKVPSSCRLFLTTLCLAAFGLGAVRAWAAAETLTVNTLSDSADSANNCGSSGTGSVCSLRDAINQANKDGSGDTIQFNSSLNGGTITLGSALPAINVSLTITGPGANLLTVSADHKAGVRVMTMGTTASVTVNISGLTIAYGNNSNGLGGGIFINQGALTVKECAFIGNFANDGGGAIDSFNSSTTVTAIDSTFSGNSSSSPGGAINADGVTVSNSTFSGNSGQDGSAIAAGGTSKVTNSTFSGNPSSTSGGGALNNSSGTLTADNNIFSGNSGGAIYNYSGTTNADSNVYYGNSANGGSDCNKCASDTNPTDASSNPLTLPFGYYGGPTETYLPQPGSAAICEGSSSETPAGATTDQRGFTLSPGYSSCASGFVDAGAVQTNYIQVQSSTDGTATSTDCQGTKCTLRDAVALANGAGDIDFKSGVNSITLSSTLALGGTAGVNIIGPGANTLTVNGGGSTSDYSVFTVDAGTPAVLYGLTISKGSSGTNGGGISNSGNLTLLSSAVTNSSSSTNGGGIANNSNSTLLVMDSTISNNTGVNGGGIYNAGAMEIAESTVSGNSVNSDVSQEGGGIDSAGTLAVFNSTIAGNSATGSSTGLGVGGGINVASGSTSLANTIVAGNTAGTNAGGTDSNIGGSYTDNGGNVIGGSTDSTTDYPGGSNTKPKITLSSLALIGPNATVNTQIPLPGSAAICAGEASQLLSGVTTDERGEPNKNTTYTGYSSKSPCVDAGAVQSNYSLSFSTEPPSSVTVGQSFGAAVTVDESGQAISGIDIPLTLSSGTLYGTTTETTDKSGVATYSGLTATAGTGLTLNVGVIPSTATNPLTVSSSTFDVTAAPTQVSLAGTASSTVNVSDTFTATVTAAPGDTVPLSGTVTFTDNGTAISGCGTSGAVTVGSWDSTTGTATAACTTSALIGGNHSIVATYGSDSNYSSSNNNLTQVVAAVNTTTTASATPTTASVNAPVTLSATVTPNGQPVPLTGPVTFTESRKTVPGCTVSWDASTGVATCTTTQLTKGQHTITATYPADASYNSSSGTADVNVTAATATMGLTSSTNPSTVNASVTFTASFTVSNGGTKPSGDIEFTYTPTGSNTPTTFSGCSAVGLTSSSAGGGTTTYTAQCSSSSLANGSYTITATYLNDSNFTISAATLTQNVSPAATTTQVQSSLNPSQVNQSVTFAATVTSQVAGSTTPAGTVTFTDTYNNSTTTICSDVSINSGAYDCATSSLVAGSHTITATFNPSDNNFKSSSGTVAQTVNTVPSSLGLTASQPAVIVDNPNNINDSVTFTATVNGPNGNNKPSGSVTFTYNGSLAIPECAAPVPVNTATDTATCTTQSLPPGADTVKAAYSGNHNFKGSNFSL